MLFYGKSLILITLAFFICGSVSYPLLSYFPFQSLLSTYEHVYVLFSNYLFTKLFIKIGTLFKALRKQRRAVIPALYLPLPNPVRTINMQAKNCNSNIKNEYAMPVHVSTIHVSPNLPTEYLPYGLNFVLTCLQVSSLENSFIIITKFNLLRILVYLFAITLSS